MNFILTLIIGAVTVFVIHQFKMLTQKAQGSIFSVIIYLEEVVLCFVNHTICIYSKNTIFSVVIMLIFPFVILFAYYVIMGFINNKK